MSPPCSEFSFQCSVLPQDCIMKTKLWQEERERRGWVGAWNTVVCNIAYHSFHQVNVIINTAIFLHFTHVRPLRVAGHKYCSLTLRLTNNSQFKVNSSVRFSFELKWRGVIMNFTLIKMFTSIQTLYLILIKIFSAKLQRKKGVGWYREGLVWSQSYHTWWFLKQYNITLHHTFYKTKKISKWAFSPVVDFCSDPSRTAYGLQILVQILQDSQQRNTGPKLRIKKSSWDWNVCVWKNSHTK